MAVENLVAPDSNKMVRYIDGKFCEKLQENLHQSSMNLIDPFVCIVSGVEKASEFNENTLEDYKYKTLGGNHRRITLQSLVSKGLFPSDTVVPIRLCFGRQ